MTSKFVVGQAVNFSKKYPWMSGGRYEVVSVLPPGQDDSTTYRVKNQMRKAAARTLDTVVAAIREVLDAYTAPERANYFANSGYT